MKAVNYCMKPTQMTAMNREALETFLMEIPYEILYSAVIVNRHLLSEKLPIMCSSPSEQYQSPFTNTWICAVIIK